jgi:PHD/YefM family antitoxin component YafN of YafNO toxin-antitoxin module
MNMISPPLREIGIAELGNEMAKIFVAALIEPIAVKSLEHPTVVVLSYNEYERIQGREKQNVYYSGWYAAFESYTHYDD